MPEHFHLLFQPWPAEATPEMMKELKQRGARSFSIVNRQSSNRQSADWPWSSWRFYFLGDRSMLEWTGSGVSSSFIGADLKRKV
jgi:REP element-mobilizing transposase RayT